MAAGNSDLIRYWLLLRQRWLPSSLVFLTVLALSIINVLAKPDIYRSTGILSLDREDDSSGLASLPSTDQLRWAKHFKNKLELDKAVQEISSTPLLQEVVNGLPRTPTGEPSLSALLGNLQITPIAETESLRISYDSTDPLFAEQVVNRLMKVYVERDLRTRRAQMTSSLQFITEQLPQVKQRLSIAETALRRFKETYKTSGIETLKTGTTEGFTLTQAQLDETTKQLGNVNAQIADLQSRLGLQSQDAIVLNSPNVQSSMQRLATVEEQLTNALASFQPGHPQVLDLQEQRQQLKLALRNQITSTASTQGASLRVSPPTVLLDRLVELEVTRQGMLQQQAILQNQRSFYQLQADELTSQLPRLEQRQQELTREVKGAEVTYQTLLQRLEEIKVAEQQTIPAVQVIEPAQLPQVPAGPNRAKAIGQGALAGLVLASAMAYLLELLDRKLRSIDAIQTVYPYTLLGTVPEFKVQDVEFPQLPILGSAHSHISEAYRTLQVKLKFLSSADEPVQVIAVTSAQPQEGKSTTAANLAVAIAQMGHRVLLVDTDLRRPSQHQIWVVKNTLGLTNILTSQGEEHNASLPTHQVADNLEVVTAGMIPPNPLTLLDSARMKEFIQTQRQQYDYIVLDTPPVTAAADPLVVGKLADGILVVAHPKVLDKHGAKVAEDTLNQPDLNILGLVVNGVTPENGGYSYYGYSQAYYEQAAIQEIDAVSKGT